MALAWGGNKSPWDFSNPSNWAINKSPEQNFREIVTGMQIIALTIPSATWGAYPGIAIGSGAGAAAAAAGTTAGAGAAGIGAAGAGAAGLAKTALDLGKDLTLTAALTIATQWLTKYWWIPTIFVGLWTVGKFGGK